MDQVVVQRYQPDGAPLAALVMSGLVLPGLGAEIYACPAGDWQLEEPQALHDPNALDIELRAHARDCRHLRELAWRRGMPV